MNANEETPKEGADGVINVSEPQAFRAELLAAGLLVATGVDGVYLRSDGYERIVQAVADVAHRSGSDQDARTLFLPPVIPRVTFESTDYLRSFPNLTGSIHTFVGGDGEHAELLRLAEAGDDWTQALSPADVVLAPAACHSLYPQLTGTRKPAQRFEVEGYCFRHEPSLDPMRMQAFRMREFVFVGDEQGAVAHRDLWLKRGLDILGGLGLEVESVVANDPFFGRAGRILATGQREAALKYEIVTPAVYVEKPTAIASANYHLDHFGGPFEISSEDGQVAHSSCFGFGLERIVLALLKTHGLDPSSWPWAVERQLWP